MRSTDKEEVGSEDPSSTSPCLGVTDSCNHRVDPGVEIRSWVLTSWGMDEGECQDLGDR